MINFEVGLHKAQNRIRIRKKAMYEVKLLSPNVGVHIFSFTYELIV